MNSDRVVARVGSTFSDVRDVIQVRLERGEKVELLEAPQPDSPWCKIAPPAGEFRWVFSKFVDRKPSSDLADDQRDDNRLDEGVRLVNSQSEAEPSRDDDRALDTAGTSSAAEFDPDVGRRRELARLELELSALVVQDISAWSFDDLEHRADELLQQAQSPVERGHVRLLLNKLERFDDIRQRHADLRKPGGEATAMPAAGGFDNRRADISNFDGVGRLSPVISDKVGGPQYALVDDANAVISFVTPAPGVNLRPYVDHYVGVNGQRGYLTELQRQHISVQRVTVLDVERQ